MFSYGVGTQRNYAEAHKYLIMAAENKSGGNYDPSRLDALFKLSEVYYYGKGVDVNYVRSYKWLLIITELAKVNIVSDTGRSVAPVIHNNWMALPENFPNIDKLLMSLNPGQIAEAQRLARQWMKSHAS